MGENCYCRTNNLVWNSFQSSSCIFHTLPKVSWVNSTMFNSKDRKRKQLMRIWKDRPGKYRRESYVLQRARILGLAICWRPPSIPGFPQLPPWVLAVRIDMTTLCLVPSTAASQARRSSRSSALDFAILSDLSALLLAMWTLRENYVQCQREVRLLGVNLPKTKTFIVSNLYLMVHSY